jgi:hypothetical protein
MDETLDSGVTATLETWSLARLRALHDEAEAAVGEFWMRAAAERSRRPKSEWGRLGVRVRPQRNARSLPGAFSIEWFQCRWANRNAQGAIYTTYIRRGKGVRYPRAAFRGLTQPWELEIADTLENRFARIRLLVHSLSQLRVAFRQHQRLEQRLAADDRPVGEGA